MPFPSKDQLLACWRRLFHDRTVMIVSDQRIRYVPLSARVQSAVCGALLLALVGGGLWRHASSPAFDDFSAEPLLEAYVPPEVSTGSIEELEDLNGHLRERLVYLERHVVRLQKEKNRLSGMITQVRAVTENRIEALNRVIAAVGLDADALRAESLAPPLSKGDRAAGGPFVPLSTAVDEGDPVAMAGQLMVLRQVVDALPLRHPLPGADTTSGYGVRVDPFNRRAAMHEGLDLVLAFGAPVRAAAAGVVTRAGASPEYGRMVEIDHGNGIRTRYGHLSRIYVRTGQKVDGSVRIGAQGNSGRSTGSHLHYEVRLDGKPLSPERFLKAGRLSAALE